MKSDVRSLIFKRKCVLANQRSERCFSHVKKKDASNQTMFFKRYFFMSEKNDTSNQKPKGVWVSHQNSCLLHVQASQDFAHIQRENLYVEAIKHSFTRRKVKSETSWKLKWNSFVYFTVNTINEEGRQNNSRRGKQKETQTGKSKDGNFTVYLCLQLCLHPRTDYVYTLYTILSLLLPSSPWFLF